MELLTRGLLLIIWIAQATMVYAKELERSRQDVTIRALQFGVVDGPTPTAKPNVPPIFAPIAVPVANTRPVSIPAPTRKPISAPGPSRKPISAPLPVPSSGFGTVGGGNMTLNDTPTTTPTAVSSTDAPTSPNDGEIEIPTSVPTSGSGVVLLDEPTTNPKTAATKAPISVVQSSAPVPSSWLSFVVTYTSELYTIVKDPKNIQDIVRTVHGDVRKSLSHLIKQQNVSIVIELLESENLGTCPGSVNITKPSDMVYPNFPICNDIRAHIITKIDNSKIFESTVRDNFIDYISDSFIPAYNKNSSLARLRYMEPINVSATLNITMVGVETEMNADESIFFVEMVRTVLLGLFLNATESNHITPMNLEIVQQLHQRSSNSKKHRQLLASSDSDADYFQGQPTNIVEVLITTSCARHRTCSDDALQTFLNEFAPQYGVPLMALLVANSQYFYFDSLRNIIIGEQTIPELLPSKGPDPSIEEKIIESEKIPVWIISLIVVICVIFTTTILYIIIRRRVRSLQDDKVRDGIHKESDDEKSNILRNTQFTPSLAPSFQQIQEWSNDYTTQESFQQQQQPSQPQARDTSIFHKRGQNKVQQPIQEYEEEDEYYDGNQYDNDQFSVEAGNFGDNAYDEHQWNSSFRSYT